MPRLLPLCLGLLAVPATAQDARRADAPERPAALAAPAPKASAPKASAPDFAARAPGGFLGLAAELTAPASVTGDRLGQGAAEIGDLDDNGFPDYAIGAVGDGPGLAGAVHIFLMGEDATVLSVVEIDDADLAGTLTGQLDASGNPVPGTNTDAQFGEAIVGIGDLDGDGVPDIAVGAPGDDTADNSGDGVPDGADDSNGFPPGPGPDGVASSTSVGAVYILFLNEDGTLKGFDRIDDTDPNIDLDQRNEATEPDTGFGNAFFGRGLALLGDLDGAGGSDLTLAVGVPGFQETFAQSRGGFFTVSLSYDGDGGVTVDGSQQFTATALAAAGAGQDGNDLFGRSLATLDLDGSGPLELAVGASFDDAEGENQGAVYVLFFDNDGGALSIAGFDKISEADLDGAPLDEQDYFGTAVAAVSDLDGDGVPELAVGAYADDGDGSTTSAGAVYVILLDYDAGAPTTVGVKSSEKIGADAGLSGTLASGDEFGFGLAFASSVNGNPGLLAGVPGQDGNRGSALLIELEEAEPPPPPPPPPPPGDVTGSLAYGDCPASLPPGTFSCSVEATGTLSAEEGQRYTVFLRIAETGRIAFRGEVKPRAGQTVVQSIRFKSRSIDPAAFTLEFVVEEGSVAAPGEGAVVLDALDFTKAPGLRAAEELSVFPNPAATSATLRFAVAGEAEATLVVYDALGRSIAQRLAEAVDGLVEVSLDGSALAPGVYVARLVLDGRTETVRFSVVR